MAKRKVKDSIGFVEIDEKNLWGPETQRSLENFKIGDEKMPGEIIKALLMIKKAAALANSELNRLEKDKAEAIIKACDKICSGEFSDQFPLSVWQTGSGTQTNMNVNEVICGISDVEIDPHDHVNMSQSTNDVFPTAINVSLILETERKLFPELDNLIESLETLEKKYEKLLKIGRTHLQDAVTLTFGQEISAWHEMMVKSKKMITANIDFLREVAAGGTAVGSGINAVPDYSPVFCKHLAVICGREGADINPEGTPFRPAAAGLSADTDTEPDNQPLCTTSDEAEPGNFPFRPATNKFYAVSSRDNLVAFHGAIKALAVNLYKMANDVRWLSSGPRCGLNEIFIPANEPGSSIMPGKVNPTQSEALMMVCTLVMGNDASIGFAASQGNFQLNVCMPLLGYQMLQSVKLLSDAISSFNKNCVKGIVANEQKMQENVDNSLMRVTVLSEKIGYQKAAQISKLAFEKNIKIKEAAMELGFLTEAEFDELWDR